MFICGKIIIFCSYVGNYYLHRNYFLLTENLAIATLNHVNLQCESVLCVCVVCVCVVCVCVCVCVCVYVVCVCVCVCVLCV
jgi:hypothetical protein